MREKLPRKCGDGLPDGFGCGLYFGPADRDAYEEHRRLCKTYTLPTTPPRVTYGSGRPVRHAPVKPQEAL